MRARAALAHGHTGRALQIFLREGVEVPAWLSAITPAMALLPDVRRYVARQIDDLDSIVQLGVRTGTYQSIDRAVWFLTGEKSPAHLRKRCERLTAALPHADLVTLPRTGHGANQSNPRQPQDHPRPQRLAARILEHGTVLSIIRACGPKFSI